MCGNPVVGSYRLDWLIWISVHISTTTIRHHFQHAFCCQQFLELIYPMTGAPLPLRQAVSNGARFGTRRLPTIHRQYAFINIVFEPHPKPINITTLVPTKETLFDSTHPYHIKASRQVAQFDPGALHWRISPSVDLCRKAMIRSTAARRFGNAFALKLKENGYERNGHRLQADGRPPLTGALFVKLRPEPASLQASKDDLRKTAGWLLETVVSMQSTHR
nr:hypothetical protein CFP56_24421 [Quercus suber]